MSQQQNKPIHKFKTPKRFRLSFLNENTFNEVWTIKMSQTRVILAIIAIVVALLCIISTIIVATPIRTLLPGYLKGSQRQEYVINSLRIDSLFTQVDITNSYIANLTDILTDNVDTLAITTPTNATQQIIPVDSIMGASEKEKQFVRQFEEKEKFNLSVLSPIIAEGMAFYTPVKGAIVSTAENAQIGITLISPYTTPISSIYNGTVIDSYYLSATGNTIIIQHPNDFISKYSGLSETFVNKGDKVKTSDRIGLIINGQQNNKRLLHFELWHNGTPLNPLDYIAF